MSPADETPRTQADPAAPTTPGLDAVVGSSLFDPEWYAAQAGCSPEPLRAARHYLRTGWRRGLSPHPLFDLRHIRRQWRGPESGDPLVAFLSDPDLRLLNTHPLFDDLHYLKSCPDAARHALGAVGHYLEIGAAAGVAPNTWYRPDPVAEPDGLADWLRRRAREWNQRRASVQPTWVAACPVAADHRPTAADADTKQDTLVSVIVPMGLDPTALAATLRSIEDRTSCSVQLILLGDSSLPDLPSGATRIAGAAGAREMNQALAKARGDFVTWLYPGEQWRPRRLERLLRAAGDTDGAHDVLEASRSGEEPHFAGGPLSLTSLAGQRRGYLSQLFIRLERARSLAPFDESLGTSSELDFVYRAHAELDLRFVDAVGVQRDHPVHRAALDRPSHGDSADEATDTWEDVLRNRVLIDWVGLTASSRDKDTISVVIPTYRDWRMTLAAVSAVRAAEPPPGKRVEVVVLDNGSGLAASTVLDSFPERFPDVIVVHEPVNHGFALGNNLALPHTTGDVVVFLNDDTEVSSGWLAPLLDPLEDPAVLGTQALLVYPSGTVRSAGAAFPSRGGLPYAFLQGFPTEDTEKTSGLRLGALTGAALVVRFGDVVRAQGFDPLFRNGMEDVDLCLRLAEDRDGYFRVVPASVVVHHESRSPGRFSHSLVNRQLFLERWAERAPRDDARLWKAVGFDVVGHEIANRVSDDERLCVHEPVLRRTSPTSITEAPPRLRWAIKNPATPGTWGDAWGDTHFAHGIAAALRRQGQEVVVDRRAEFARASGHLDDVVLVLRGRETYRPRAGHVNLAWVISHPETFTRDEAGEYHHVLAASEPWSRHMARKWALPIRPLLQATDPARFDPDRALPDTGHPLLFVGNSRHTLRPMVERAVRLGLPIHVFGRYWESLIPDDVVRGEFIPNDMLGIAYRSARIVLNDHWETMSEHGFISNRIFDAVAAGARVVSDPVDGLQELFGRSVQVATTDEQFIRLVTGKDLDSVFGDDEERRKIADRVQREHSFDARARDLLDLAVPTWRESVGTWPAARDVPTAV